VINNENHRVSEKAQSVHECGEEHPIWINAIFDFSVNFFIVEITQDE